MFIHTNCIQQFVIWLIEFWGEVFMFIRRAVSNAKMKGSESLSHIEFQTNTSDEETGNQTLSSNLSVEALCAYVRHLKYELEILRHRPTGVITS